MAVETQNHLLLVAVVVVGLLSFGCDSVSRANAKQLGAVYEGDGLGLVAEEYTWTDRKLTMWFKVLNPSSKKRSDTLWITARDSDGNKGVVKHGLNYVYDSKNIGPIWPADSEEFSVSWEFGPASNNVVLSIKGLGSTVTLGPLHR